MEKTLKKLILVAVLIWTMLIVAQVARAGGFKEVETDWSWNRKVIAGRTIYTAVGSITSLTARTIRLEAKFVFKDASGRIVKVRYLYERSCRILGPGETCYFEQTVGTDLDIAEGHIYYRTD